MPSKSRIDKAGYTLARPINELTEEILELEDVLDDYRKSHLQPLTKMMAEVQNWLTSSARPYYIAQRLKRKPQILRKLNRLSVRLTQLQDIGGFRIIVDDNSAVDWVSNLINDQIKTLSRARVHRTTDYRAWGRDDSGYRALHKILFVDGVFVELQIRSRAQHHWAETVERTSVVYGHRLKEGMGDQTVISYFRLLSNIFNLIEDGYVPVTEDMTNLNRLRNDSEILIRQQSMGKILDSYVNEDVIKTLIQTEKSNPRQINNWILVFDWATANFVTWDIVSRKPEEAVSTYADYERQFPETQNYEVVLIGSSDVSTVRQTHSHYFGIGNHDQILKDLGQSVIRISENFSIDAGAKQILYEMHKKKIIGSYAITVVNLKKHFCKSVDNFDDSLQLLIRRGLVVKRAQSNGSNARANKNRPVSLNLDRIGEIESYL